MILHGFDTGLDGRLYCGNHGMTEVSLSAKSFIMVMLRLLTVMNTVDFQ